MKKKTLSIEIFGADIICASCVNAPTSKDTYEWLQAAIGRKYPDQPYEITYIDIQKPADNERQQDLANRVLDDEFFYPLVLIEGKVIGEGNIQLNPVFMELEKYGFISDQS